MPYKLVPTAYEKVELTEEEIGKKNALQRKHRNKVKEQDPEAWKAKEKLRNRQAYLRRKQKLADAKALAEQTQPQAEQKPDMS